MAIPLMLGSSRLGLCEFVFGVRPIFREGGVLVFIVKDNIFSLHLAWSPLYATEEGAYFRSLQRTDQGREDMSHYAHDMKLFRGCGQSFLEGPKRLLFNMFLRFLCLLLPWP